MLPLLNNIDRIAAQALLMEGILSDSTPGHM